MCEETNLILLFVASQFKTVASIGTNDEAGNRWLFQFCVIVLHTDMHHRLLMIKYVSLCNVLCDHTSATTMFISVVIIYQYETNNRNKPDPV